MSAKTIRRTYHFCLVLEVGHYADADVFAAWLSRRLKRLRDTEKVRIVAQSYHKEKT